MQSKLFNSIGNNFFVAVVSRQLDARVDTRAKKTALIFVIVALALALFIAAIYQHNKNQKITASPLPHKPKLADPVESEKPRAVAPAVQTSEPKPSEIPDLTTTVVKEPQTIDVDKQELPKEAPSIPALEETSEKVQTVAEAVEITKVVKEPQTADADRQKLPTEIISTISSEDLFEQDKSELQQSGQNEQVEIKAVMSEEDRSACVSAERTPEKIVKIATTDVCPTSALEETPEKVQAAAQAVETSTSELPFVSAVTDVKKTEKMDFDWERKQPFADPKELIDNAISCPEFKALYDRVETAAQLGVREPDWTLIQSKSPKEAFSSFIHELAMISLFLERIEIDEKAKKGKFTGEEYVKAKTKNDFDRIKLYHTTMQAVVRACHWKTPWKPESPDLTNVDFEEYWDKNKKGYLATMYRNYITRYLKEALDTTLENRL